MKTFLVALNIFTLLIYIIYAFICPISNDTYPGKLFDLYTVIMILEIVAAILVICQIMSGARRIEMVNRDLGKCVKK